MKKRILIITGIILHTIVGIAQIPGNVPTNGLVGWWPFNSNGNDLSGNGNNLTNFGATLTSDRSGTPNSAYQFNGTSQYLISNAPSFSFGQTGTFSFSVWLKRQSNLAGVALMSGTTVNNNYIWLLQNSSTNSMFGTNKQGSAWIWTLTPYGQNQWEHYAGVYNAGAMTFYKNGVQVSTNTYTYLNAIQAVFPFYVGRGVSGNYFEGFIDDIGVWNRVLTQSEITNLYSGCDVAIVTNPQTQTANPTDNVGFTVTATNPNLNFQWQINTGTGFQNITNGGQFSGATTNSLLVSNTLISNSGNLFRCIVSNSSCADTSAAANLNVVCNLGLTSQPQDQTIPFSNNATFSVSANINATFQWQINTGTGFVNLSNSGQFSGVNTSTLSISNISYLNENNLFRCIVSSPGPCDITSDVAKLNVSCTLAITNQPANQNVSIPSIATFSVSSSENNVDYQWQTDLGSGFQNIIDGGQYSGATSSTLSISNTTLGNDNQTFRCIVSTALCSDTSIVAVLNVSCVLAITSQPQNQLVVVPAGTTFSVSASDPSANFQWQRDNGSGFVNLVDGGQFNGTNSPLLIVSNSTVNDDKSLFRCIVSANSCSDTSDVAELSIICSFSFLDQPQSLSLNVGQTATFQTGSTEPTANYQWQIDIGSGFLNLLDTGNVSGSETSLLTLSNVSVLNNNNLFRCVASFNGCLDSTSVATLTVIDITSVENYQASNNLVFYPNPVNGTAFLIVTETQIGFPYTIYDVYGKRLRSEKIENIKTELNLTQLSAGFYFIEVGQGRKNTLRFIKQ
jgi:predicted secreted protein